MILSGIEKYFKRKTEHHFLDFKNVFRDAYLSFAIKTSRQNLRIDQDAIKSEKKQQRKINRVC